eukprot:c20185_g1_i1.p1 GENE.c20185_g1_i1~~c20185_g1_i1.p1  ORF type:complete len:296 (+),score=130.98 c20185_g1_i1:103-888(+)
MGWCEGEGLGKDGQGRKVAIKPAKKIDKMGIGAQHSHTNWIKTSIAYDDILSKLNFNFSSEADDKKKKRKRDEDDEDDDEEDDEDVDSQISDDQEKEASETNKNKKKEKKEKKEKKSSSSNKKKENKKNKKKKSKKNESEEDNSDKDEESNNDDVSISVSVNRRTPLSKTDHLEIFGRPSKIEFDSKRSKGFTEDTQVQIYDSLMNKQVKGRKGLGLIKITKSERKIVAQQDSQLMRKGSYLSKKFEFGGYLTQFTLKASA